MAILSHSEESVSVFVFLALSAICAISSAFTVLRYQQLDQQIPFIWIVGSAVLFRLIGVLGQPILEDDFYRYLWDGYQMITSGNPYTAAPAAFFTDTSVPGELEDVLSRINYPDVATIYGPVCQWIFGAAYLIDAGAVWPLQLIAALADVGIMLILWSIRRNNFILLYACSPLLIKEFALTAHSDIVAVLFVLAAMQAQFRNQPWITGILLGLATGTKIFALLLIPFLIFRLKRQNHHRQMDWKYLLFCSSGLLITLSLITLSFGTTVIWFPPGLSTMATHWLFNAPIYLLLINVVDFSALKFVLLTLFTLFISIHLATNWQQTGQFPWFRGDWIYGVFFLCLPVVNPWYLAWILPFAVIIPSKWAWTASGCMLLSYLSGTHLDGQSLGLHQIPLWVVVVEYGLILAAYAHDKRIPLCELNRKR